MDRKQLIWFVLFFISFFTPHLLFLLFHGSPAIQAGVSTRFPFTGLYWPGLQAGCNLETSQPISNIYEISSYFIRLLKIFSFISDFPIKISPRCLKEKCCFIFSQLVNHKHQHRILRTLLMEQQFIMFVFPQFQQQLQLIK